ncbi:MAG TPA: hypothetical protein DEO94_04165 [Cyanobacteria bacterium UBA11991]|nr:hypothetical protein [Cyanobacteriota bacterium]MDY6359297.1 hypothetical protein [Cyanobacteriota bacterium]MDY6364819.1 hypothetical protein [Cyanobacteriota bacterium]MDY6382807.1 hypothetical protein [Cyanobacteriota bacterium]HCB11330.1 hypothetical protein [Cyanobacteria bacterium UBA11991]
MLDRINTAQSNNSKYFLNTCINSNAGNNNSAAVQDLQTPKSDELSKRKKAFVFATSALAMTPVIAYKSKKSGFSLNPLKIIQTPAKNWALFKYKPVDKAVDFAKAGGIIAMAASSIVGGLIGGAIVDKENFNAKKKEALNQILGDVLTPIGCVWAGAKLFKAVQPKVDKIIPQIKSDKSVAKVANKVLKGIPNAVAMLVPLVIGILAGNRVSNDINEKLYHKKVDRHIRITDFAPHVDDLCMSISMVNEGSTTGSLMGRLIPWALVVPGFETGTARDNK